LEFYSDDWADCSGVQWMLSCKALERKQMEEAAGVRSHFSMKQVLSDRRSLFINPGRFAIRDRYAGLQDPE
jgi:hypothetical protein